jgi:hypothetical protein
MSMRRLKGATVGAVLATPFAAMPAMAAACFVGETAPASFTCSESNVTTNGLTFTNILVSALVSGSGSIVLGSLTPFSPAAGEFGLRLSYVANTGNTANSTADISLTYNVAGNLINDAFLSFVGSSTGTGRDNISETITFPNGSGTTLALASSGSTMTTFAPVASLAILKDQDNFSGAEGSSTSSALVNAFSLNTVPAPAALPLFVTGLVGGLLGLFRKKKAKGRSDPAAA